MVEEWEPPEGEPGAGVRSGGPATRLLALLTVVVVAVVAFNALPGLLGGDDDAAVSARAKRPTATSPATSPAPSPRPVPAATRTATRTEPSTPSPTRTQQTRADAERGGCQVTLGGLLLGGNALRGTGLERWQREGRLDRQVLVVRRNHGGSLGTASAAVTWPLALEEAVATGLAPTTVAERHELVWPLAGHLARIRGSLTGDQLAGLAQTATVLDGRLVVAPPAGYTILYGGRCDEGVQHEVRYSPYSAGVDSVLSDGLVFTGLQRVGTFEDELLARGPATAVGAVGSHPAVLVDIGSAAVAWEPATGVVAYVGYSGPAPTPALVRLLLDLAEDSRVIPAGEFSRLLR